MREQMDSESTSALRLEPKPAFILGNGPSLKDIDLHQLTPYSTLGMNAAYRHWDRINWRPTHYACLDTVVGISHLDEIRRLIREGRDGESGSSTAPPQIGTFALRHNVIEALGADADDPRVIDFDALRARTALLRHGLVTTGSHSLLWMIHLGFDPIILLGIDGNYKEIVSGARKKTGLVLEIIEQQDNPNYFFPDYQLPGDRYHVPNPIPGLHAEAWVDAARGLGERAAVANGNPDSSVRIFPFVNLPTLLDNDEAPLTPGEPIPPEPGALESVLRQYMRPLTIMGLGALITGAIAGALAAFDWTVLLAFLFAALVSGTLLILTQLVRPLRSFGSLQRDIQDVHIALGEMERQIRINSCQDDS